MKNLPKHFYLFKGNWFNLYDEMIEMLQPDELQKFNIWEPRDKTKSHCLLTVYGMPLADSYCSQRGVWKTDDKVFIHFYLNQLEKFIIHGKKEKLNTATPVL